MDADGSQSAATQPLRIRGSARADMSTSFANSLRSCAISLRAAGSYDMFTCSRTGCATFFRESKGVSAVSGKRFGRWSVFLERCTSRETARVESIEWSESDRRSRVSRFGISIRIPVETLPTGGRVHEAPLRRACPTNVMFPSDFFFKNLASFFENARVEYSSRSIDREVRRLWSPMIRGRSQCVLEPPQTRRFNRSLRVSGRARARDRYFHIRLETLESDSLQRRVTRGPRVRRVPGARRGSAPRASPRARTRACVVGTYATHDSLIRVFRKNSTRHSALRVQYTHYLENVTVPTHSRATCVSWTVPRHALDRRHSRERERERAFRQSPLTLKDQNRESSLTGRVRGLKRKPGEERPALHFRGEVPGARERHDGQQSARRQHALAVTGGAPVSGSRLERHATSRER